MATIAIHLAMLVLGQIAFHCARYTYIFVYLYIIYMYKYIYRYIGAHIVTRQHQRRLQVCGKAPSRLVLGVGVVLFCFYKTR